MPLAPNAVRAGTILLVVAMLLAVRTVSAQGTSRAFPDPLSFSEMTDLLEPLGLSEAQRAATGVEHAAYLDGFRVLRGGAIEAYLAEFGSYPLDYREDRAEIVEGMKRRQAILREIDQHEMRFFAAVESVLSDEQKTTLPRLAERRERARLATNPSSQGWELPSLRRLDLVAEIGDLDLSADRRAEIDAIVAAYEISLTPLFRKIHGDRLDLPLAFHDRTWAARRAFQDRMEALQARFDLETPEGQREYAEAVTAELLENPAASPMPEGNLTEEIAIRKQFVRVSRHNRRLLADARGLLEPDEAARLERRVSQRAYGSLGIPGDPVRKRIDKHLDDEATPEELRTALEDLRTGYRGSRSILVDRLIAAGEEAEFSGSSLNTFFFSTNGETTPEKKESPVAALRQEIRDLNDRTLKTYAELTGEEVAMSKRRSFEFPGGEGGAIVIESADGAAVTVELDGAMLDVGPAAATTATATAVSVFVTSDGGGDLEAGTWVVGGMEGVVLDAPDLEFDFAADPDAHDGGNFVAGSFDGTALPRARGWLPRAINEKFIDALARELALDATDRPILDALYDDYRAAFQALDEQIIAPARSAGRSAARMGFGMHGDGESAEPLEPAAAFDRVRSAMAAIAGLDQQFFGDLALVITRPESKPVVDRAVLARCRDAHGHLGGGGMFTGLTSGSREQYVDLVALSQGARAHLDEADLTASRESLGAYDGETAELYVQRWNASLEAAQHRAERMQEAMRRSGESRMIMVDLSGESTDSPAGAARLRADAAESALRDLNQRTLPALAAKLSETGHAALRDAYHREAFPTVFRDRAALERTFEQAMALGLAGEKRARVEDLWLDYRGAYAGICERMVDRIRTFDREAKPMSGGMGMEPGAFERFEALQRDLEADRFERRDLSERSRQALRDVLGDEDAERLGIGEGEGRAIGVPGDYHVQAFPTLFVIDRKGVVRDVHVGYTPDLYEKVLAEVRRLLSEP